jgi:hypothetical protein
VFGTSNRATPTRFRELPVGLVRMNREIMEGRGTPELHALPGMCRAVASTPALPPPRGRPENLPFPAAGDFSNLNGSTRQRKRGNSEAVPSLCSFPSYVQAMLSTVNLLLCSVPGLQAGGSHPVQEDIAVWTCGDSEQILTS